jgi:hypothetical protein
MRAKYNTWLMCNDDGDSILLEQSPIGWDAVKFNLIRDLTYLGIMKSISVEYEFVGDGFRFLQSKRLKYGIDADILLRQYINNPNQWLFDGKVNQENYNEDRKFRKYKVDIVQSSFVQNFQNREDIVVNVLNNISLDRQSIEPASLANCLFRGKQIEFYSEFEGSSLTEPEIYHHTLPFFLKVNGNAGVNSTANIFPGSWDETTEDDPLIEVGNATYVNLLPGAQEPLFTWSFNVSLSYRGNTNLNPAAEIYIDYRFLLVNEDNSVDSTIYFNRITLDWHVHNTLTLDLSGTFAPSVQPNQFIVLLCEHRTNLPPVILGGDELEITGRVEIIYNTMEMTIAQNSNVSDSIHPVILPHELFSNLVAQINGGSLYSEVFGRTELGYYADGEFAYLGITKGELLRGIDPSEVQIPTSMRDAYKSYSSIIGLGALITERQIRIDPLEILFNSNITTDLGEVNDLQISPAKEFLFNSVKAGYPKNEYEQENGRDEFNTQYQYTNSFKSVKKELDLMSVYNGDGYGIEFARRASVITTGTADSRYDDIIFLVDMILDGETLMTRRLEGILEVSGIFSPETALNLRIAVGQNMLRQKKFLNIPLHKKDKLYFFQSKDKNASLHLVTDLGTTNDGQDLDTGEIALFLPDQRGFNVPITIERLFAILANPLGLIQYRYKREDFFDYLMEVDSETDKGKGQWRTLGTRDTPVEIVDDAQEGNILMHDDGLTDYVAHDDAEDDLVLYE